MNYKLKKSEKKYTGHLIDVKVDEIQFEDNGKEAKREVAVHPGGAVILAVNKDNKILFIEQFRYPTGKTLLELPAGKLEQGEDPYDCATRELEEETGWKAGAVTKMGQIFTSPGFCDEILHIYLAKDLSEGKMDLQEGEESIKVHPLSREEINRKLKTGEFEDAKTLSALLMYFAQDNT